MLKIHPVGVLTFINNNVSIYECYALQSRIMLFDTKSRINCKKKIIIELLY